MEVEGVEPSSAKVSPATQRISWCLSHPRPRLRQALRLTLADISPLTRRGSTTSLNPVPETSCQAKGRHTGRSCHGLGGSPNTEQLGKFSCHHLGSYGEPHHLPLRSARHSYCEASRHQKKIPFCCQGGEASESHSAPAKNSSRINSKSCAAFSCFSAAPSASRSKEWMV